MGWLLVLLPALVGRPWMGQEQPTFTIVPNCSGVRAISGDGKTLLVTVGDEHEVTAVWTKEHGITVLPVLKGYARCVGTVLSGDGNTVAGHYEGGGHLTVAFRWTRAGGPKVLNTGSGWIALSEVSGISHDGSTIAGSGIPSTVKMETPSLTRGDQARPMEAFCWTSDAGAEHLGFADPQFPYSSAWGVSRNGKFVGGWGALDKGGPTDTGGRYFQQQPILWAKGKAPLKLEVGKTFRGSVRGFSPSGDLYVVAEENADNIWRDGRRFIELPRPPPRRIDGVLLAGSGVHWIHTDEPLVVATDGSLWTAKSGWVARDRIMALADRKEEGSGNYFAGYSEDLSVMVGGGWGKDNKQYAWMISFPKGSIQKLISETKPPSGLHK